MSVPLLFVMVSTPIDPRYFMWQALWAVWVPSQLVNFAFVPRYFR